MRTALAVMMMIACASTAQAQGVSIDAGVGVGYARALHGDLDFGDAAISGTARVRLARLVAFEAQVGYWQHTTRRTFSVPPDVVTTTETRKFPNVTASVLAVSDPNARIGPYGGAGVGVYYLMSRYEQSGASPFLQTYDTWHVTAGGQLIAGVDVRASRRMKVFGEFRFEVQSFNDPGSSTYRALGGVRVKIA